MPRSKHATLYPRSPRVHLVITRNLPPGHYLIACKRGSRDVNALHFTDLPDPCTVCLRYPQQPRQVALKAEHTAAIRGLIHIGNRSEGREIWEEVGRELECARLLRIQKLPTPVIHYKHAKFSSRSRRVHMVAPITHLPPGQYRSPCRRDPRRIADLHFTADPITCPVCLQYLESRQRP